MAAGFRAETWREGRVEEGCSSSGGQNIVFSPLGQQRGGWGINMPTSFPLILPHPNFTGTGQEAKVARELLRRPRWASHQSLSRAELGKGGLKGQNTRHLVQTLG